MLVTRWATATISRSLGFDEIGAVKLSSTKETLPILARQLQGLAVLNSERIKANVVEDNARFFEDFLVECGADDWTGAEFRAMVVGSSQASRPAGSIEALDLHVDAIIGSEKGSALAIWTMEEDTIRVEFIMGHDCLEFGLVAEEKLLRLIAGRGAQMGAKSLRCRARFTQDGMLFIPSLENLGFQRAPGQAWDGEVAVLDTVSAVDQKDLLGDNTAFFEKAAETEVVPGLRLWLMVMNLEDNLEAVNAWCEELGAAEMNEVIDGREDLVEALGDQLSSDEREVLLARDH